MAEKFHGLIMGKLLNCIFEVSDLNQLEPNMEVSDLNQT